MSKELHYLAEEYYRNADYRNALNIYLKLLQENPYKIGTLISIGNCYDFLGDKKSAIESYKKAHKINKKMPVPLCNLAIVYYEMGDIKSSMKYVKKTLKADKRNVSAMIIMGNILHQEGCYKEALDSYIKAYNINNKHYTSCINIANTYSELKEYSKAIKYAKEAIEISPENAAPYSVLGNLYKELEQYDKALENLEKAVVLDSKDAWIHNYLSQVYQKKHKYKEALEEGYKAVKYHEKDNSQHISFGYALYEMLGFERKLCIEYAKKWLEEYPLNNITIHMANAIINNEPISRANDEYLKNIFDVFAHDFEEVLEGLEYEAPKLINGFLIEIYGEKPTRKMKILDAGCGTGLCGKFLKKYSKLWGLSGVDISEKMIAASKRKKIYNSLFIDEIVSFLSKQNRGFDLIVSSDVFTYFGDLKELFSSLNRALKKEGRIIFTITENLENEDVFLHSSGRFLHSENYIKNILKDTNFELEKISRNKLRNEADKEVMGFVISALKRD